MGINVEITEVNKEANFLVFTQDGKSVVKDIIFPANVKFARVGKAEVGFSTDGKVNFVRSLAPKVGTKDFNGQYRSPVKPETGSRAISTQEVREDVTPLEIKAVYDAINARENAKCAASTYHLKPNGKYDAFFFVTTFERKTPAQIQPIHPTPQPVKQTLQSAITQTTGHPDVERIYAETIVM